MKLSIEALLARRLLIVTGKGGTGKTTLAATLATLAASRGLDTVLVDLADGEDVRPLLSKDPDRLPPGDGRQPIAVSPSLSLLTIDPLESLTEYLEIELRIRPLVRLLVGNAGFQRLLEAAPGWRDLITLGKLWHLSARREPPPDLIVVDAPATGHGLSFLSVPGVVTEAVRLGPLRRHSEAVRSMLTDSDQTLVVPVTLPEELPVRETLELRRGVEALGVTIGPVIVNGVEAGPDLPGVFAKPGDPAGPSDPGGETATGLDGLLERLSSGPIPEDLADLVSPEIVREALEHRSRRAALQASFIAELRRELDVPVAELPYLSDGVTGPDALEHLAPILERRLA